MKVDLYQKGDGKWQADVVLPDGRDCHAVAHSPGLALIELGSFIESQAAPSDLSTLAAVMIESRRDG